MDKYEQELECLREFCRQYQMEIAQLKAENEQQAKYIAELEQLCDKTYVKQGADAYNHCCEVFEAWRSKREEVGLPTHKWEDGLYNSLNWLQNTIEQLETDKENAQYCFRKLKEINDELESQITAQESVKRNAILLNSIAEAARCLGVAQAKEDKDAIEHFNKVVDDLVLSQQSAQEPVAKQNA